MKSTRRWPFLSQGIVSFVFGLCVLGLYFFGFEQVANAQDVAGSAVDLAEEVRDMPVSSTVRLLFILTALSVVPAMILAMTPFTRFVIVFSMMRQAIGLQQAPPNQVLIGLSLFLSLMIMNKPLTQVYDEAITPFMEGEMEVLDATETAMEPMRNFMLANTRRADLQTMLNISQTPEVETLEEINIQGRKAFIKNGGEKFDLIPCLNDNTDHILLFKDLVKKYF